MKNMKRNAQKGFTLIELMIVIAIVAILVALAVPAYRDYTVRTKVAECINGGAIAKLGISEFHQTSGTFPTSRAEGGLDTAAGTSQFCGPITYTSGASFTVTGVASAIGAGSDVTAVLTGTIASGGGVDWECTPGGSSEVKYLPSSCRS